MSAAITPLPTSVDLFYKEGSSDKEYHVQIVGNDANGYVVNFQYGRVGSKLSTGTKTKAPVDLKMATAIFTSLYEEKYKKGYRPREGAEVSYQPAIADKVKLGLMPQLLNFITEERALELLSDDDWLMQEKKDGVRCMIKKEKKTITGGNKQGYVSSLPTSVVEDVKSACGEADVALDGELVGEIFWLFDLLFISVHAFADKPYKARLEAIVEWIFYDLADFKHLKMVPTAIGTASKKALWNRLRKENAEGVVFKRLDSLYKPGRPNSGGNQLKHKFLAEATVRVRALNDKNSFQMEVLDKGDWVYVGDCTYYPTKYTPKVGDIIVVRYMYVKGEGGCLFQPIVEEGNPRNDLKEDDCLKSQLKYKQGSVEDDDA